jgi:hypothetical protein
MNAERFFVNAKSRSRKSVHILTCYIFQNSERKNVNVKSRSRKSVQDSERKIVNTKTRSRKRVQLLKLYTKLFDLAFKTFENERV